MKIWIIGSGEPIYSDGGERLQRYGVLARHLATAGHAVTWWASDFSHSKKAHCAPPNSRAVVEGVEVVFVHTPAYRRNVGLGRLFSVSVQASHLRRVMAFASLPDIILCAMPTIEASDVAVKLANSVDRPIVVDIRDEWPEDYVRWLPTWLRGAGRLLLGRKFLQLKRACRGATALVGVSQRQLEYGLQHAGRQQGALDQVIYLGARKPFVAEDQRAALRKSWLPHSASENMFVCAFAGTLSAARPLGPVIDAVLRLADRIPIRLLIAGSGDAEADLRRRAGGHKAIYFGGWSSQPALAALLDVADVALAPYHSDFAFSLPTKMFEYMAAGLPIVSSCGGEAAALIERERLGINYRFDDSAALESALAWLHEHPAERRAMGDASREIFKQRFDQSAICVQFEAYLQRVLNNERRPQ